jgi:predicted ATPase
VPATPLVGRDEDVAAVAALLSRSSVRLVTLTGIGGIGKTRLALAVAERIGPAMTDGVAYLSLAPVLDEALLWPELGRALGVEAAGSAGNADEILAVATSLEMLLVLDNCEHLLGVAGIVTGLLDRCPDLLVLATSRASLRVRAETEYLVPPLRLPQTGTVDLLVLMASPAATLLVERGRAVRRELSLRTEDAPAVAGICHRLAGLPLALELAAVGLRVLDPATLLTHLDEVLGRAGPIDLPARQRTMRATLDWSYELLPPPDQAVFRRASVFVGGFSLQAASVVLGDAGVIDALDRLAAQSLCTTGPSADGGVRYGMLEPVAQYGRSLLEGDEETAARLAHAEYFLVEAEHAGESLHGSELLKALSFFDTEESNLWSAQEWVSRTGRSDLAGRFIWALFIFWWVRGRRERGRELIATALGLGLPDALRARVLHAAAALSDPAAGPPEAVEQLYLESVELAERCGDQVSEAPSAIGAGLIALERGDPRTAEKRLRQGLAAAQRLGDVGDWSAGLAHSWLAMVRRFQGDASGAIEHANRALAITGRTGDTLSHSIALYNLANAELDLQQHDQARKHLVEAVELCRATRDASNLSYALDSLAAVELVTGGRQRVPTLLGAAEAQREAVGSAGYRWYAPDVELRRRTAEAAREQLGDDAYQRAFDAGISLALDGAVELARRQVPTTG